MGILIVEKDNKSAELIYDIFIKDINNLFFASDCNQASIAFRKYNPTVVIIDLDISFVDVVELIKTIKIENKKIKIIAIYSVCEIKDIEENLENYEIDALIHKNFLDDSLYDAYHNLNTLNEIV